MKEFILMSNTIIQRAGKELVQAGPQLSIYIHINYSYIIYVLI